MPSSERTFRLTSKAPADPPAWRKRGGKAKGDDYVVRTETIRARVTPRAREWYERFRDFLCQREGRRVEESELLYDALAAWARARRFPEPAPTLYERGAVHEETPEAAEE